MMNERRSGGFNRSQKLIGGLTLVIGIGVVIAALASGSAVVSFLPFLLTLACPLMMLLMMGSMHHQTRHDGDERNITSSDAAPDPEGLTRDERIRVLRQDLERLERERPVDADSTASAR